MYRVKQEKFEGPLDVLLDLIENQKLSINEIALARVTDEFVAFFKSLEEGGKADPEILAEFIVIASQLLLIKSRSLLPSLVVSTDEETSIAELQTRLAEYQKLKILSGELGKLARGGQKSFSREAYANRAVIFTPPKKLTLEKIRSGFLNLLEAIPKIEKLVEEKIRKVISLEEKIAELRSILKERVERMFSEIISGSKEKIDVIVSFLAILELSKQKLIGVEQTKLFEDIRIKKIV